VTPVPANGSRAPTTHAAAPANDRPVTTQAAIARSLGLPKALSPHTARVFRGVDALGCWSREIDLVIKALPSPPRRVLDLACGKGHAARRFAMAGASVTGVDACDAFIREARRAARGLSCRFIVGDVRRHPTEPRVDLASMLGLFGTLPATRLLRRHVDSGGHYLFDDCVGMPGRASAELREVPTLAASRRLIESTGDRIVRERVIPVATVRAAAAAMLRTCAPNLAELVRTHPEVEEASLEFLESHQAAAELLTGRLRPVYWLVRKR
jgi:SAM-dependent methyltransferase